MSPPVLKKQCKFCFIESNNIEFDRIYRIYIVEDTNSDTILFKYSQILNCLTLHETIFILFTIEEVLPLSLKASTSRVVLSQTFKTLTEFLKKKLRFIIPN